MRTVRSAPRRRRKSRLSGPEWGKWSSVSTALRRSTCVFHGPATARAALAAIGCSPRGDRPVTRAGPQAESIVNHRKTTVRSTITVVELRRLQADKLFSRNFRLTIISPAFQTSECDSHIWHRQSAYGQCPRKGSRATAHATGTMVQAMISDSQSHSIWLKHPSRNKAQPPRLMNMMITLFPLFRPTPVLRVIYA